MLVGGGDGSVSLEFSDSIHILNIGGGQRDKGEAIGALLLLSPIDLPCRMEHPFTNERT